MHSRVSIVLTCFSAFFAAALAFAACGRTARPERAASAVPSFLETPVAARPSHKPETISAKALYDKNCAHCHGEQGDGNGFAAPHLVQNLSRSCVTLRNHFCRLIGGEIAQYAACNTGI